MKFFIDTADLDEIKQAADMGLLDGVTTNPTLIKRAGLARETAIETICGLVPGPVSAEALGPDAETFVEEGLELAKIADNVVVKLPTNSAGLKVTAVGLEPTPFRTGALSQRLRPLGQTVLRTGLEELCNCADSGQGR